VRKGLDISLTNYCRMQSMVCTPEKEGNSNGIMTSKRLQNNRGAYAREVVRAL